MTVITAVSPAVNVDLPSSQSKRKAGTTPCWREGGCCAREQVSSEMQRRRGGAGAERREIAAGLAMAPLITPLGRRGRSASCCRRRPRREAAGGRAGGCSELRNGEHVRQKWNRKVIQLL